jgi:flagellar basal body-associated protein FliL
VPFSANNPNRNRNYVITILSVVVCFAIVMGGYLVLSYAHRDTESYMRFITLLVVTLIPSLIGAWNALKAKENSQLANENALKAATKASAVADKVDSVDDKLNGGFDERLRQANRDTDAEKGNGAGNGK